MFARVEDPLTLQIAHSDTIAPALRGASVARGNYVGAKEKAQNDAGRSSGEACIPRRLLQSAHTSNPCNEDSDRFFCRVQVWLCPVFLHASSRV